MPDARLARTRQSLEPGWVYQPPRTFRQGEQIAMCSCGQYMAVDLSAQDLISHALNYHVAKA